MTVIRGFVDPNFSGRDWNLASAMVINGEAAFQFMGDWAKGEFLNAGKVPDQDFLCFRFPGTAEQVTFNTDQAWSTTTSLALPGGCLPGSLKIVVGDVTCTGAVESDATTLEDIVKEISAARVTERGGRADDRRSEAAMEDRKKAGYF